MTVFRKPGLGFAPAHSADLTLEDGARVAVVGSGPAGSFFSYFLLDMCARAGLSVDVDLYEPRDFTHSAPQGCNMCGGIISESLVQNLAAEGICLPPSVIQRGIDSYVLHTDVGSARIATPLDEMRIGAVHRGAGPRDVKERKWESFDHHLQEMALSKGARLVSKRVDEARWDGDRPSLSARGGTPERYDLVAVAVGVNSSALKVFEALGIGYCRPTVTKTLIREYHLGEACVAETLGSSMHVFLLNIPRLEFAAIIPKGAYVTMCLLGESIDERLVQAFVDAPAVKRCMPPGWRPDERSCQCMPHISVQGVAKPYADRVVFIGDCGVTRLYKDGIGAAYRVAKAAARTAVFQGVSNAAFREHYGPVCRRIAADNRLGKLMFLLTRVVQRVPIARRAIVHQVACEQQKRPSARHMSAILWGMFSGSAPYRDIFLRALDPRFVGQFMRSIGAATLPRQAAELEEEARR